MSDISEVFPCVLQKAKGSVKPLLSMTIFPLLDEIVVSAMERGFR